MRESPNTPLPVDSVADAWQRYSQRIHYQWPCGFGGHAALQTERIMCESAFIYAAQQLIREPERTAAHRLADMYVIADIETCATRVGDWWDTRFMFDRRELCDESIDMNRQALDYAMQRGLVHAHPEHAHLVRINKAHKP